MKKNIIKKTFISFLFLITLKKFIFTIIFTIFCKIFFPIKKNTKNFKNCFFSYERNLIKYKDLQVDRQYGFYQFRKKASCFVVFLIPNLNTIFNFIKKKNQFSSLHLNYTIFNSHIAILDIFKIYLRVFVYWFKLRLILSKKNFFTLKIKIAGMFYKLYKSSFMENTRCELIFGLALKEFMNSNNFERFYNYLEFLQFSKSFYHFVKSSNPKIKIITINHYPYDENLLFFCFK